MTQDFEAVTLFILELEKLKAVERRTKPLGLSRYENSAEHSWQIALLAVSLLPYSEHQLDATKVITMLLLHDVVEIDTGDKFAYDANHDDYENELAAAKRIFALLPQQQHQLFLDLWIEFEQAQTPEAKFAKAIDRMMPVLQNLNNNCQSWLAHGISLMQVLDKNQAVAGAHPALWEWLKEQVLSRGQAAGVPLHSPD